MRILLIEDSLKLADWIAKTLRASGYAVDCAADGVQGDHILLTQQFDAVVLDLNLPKMDGLEVLRRLRQRGSLVPVLILTVRGDVDDRVKGLNFGADDYLRKPFDLAELHARIKALIRRAQGGGAPTITLGPLGYDSVSRMFRLHDEKLDLRPREHAVLEVLIHRANKAVSRETLYNKIFAMDAATTNPEAVEIYVHRLRKRLHDSGVTIVTLRGLGYLLEISRPAV